MGRHLSGEGVGGIDDDVDFLIRQIGFEPRDTAEPAAAERDRRLYRVLGAAGQRQDRVEIGPAHDVARQSARLGGAAQNQKSHETAFKGFVG